MKKTNLPIGRLLLTIRRFYSFTFCLLFIFGSTSFLKGQCMLVEVSLKEKVEASVSVIEGRVVSSRSFWDDTEGNIFTAHEIEVLKIFKGDCNLTTVDLLTRGGTVGDQSQIDYPSLKVRKGNIGIFFLLNNQVFIAKNEVTGRLAFQPTTGTQGMIKYNLHDGSAYTPFHSYKNIEKDIYKKIQKIVQANYSEVRKYEVQQKINLYKSSSAAITSFSPATITAGTASQLTINGTGFGATQGSGKVEFADADNGGATTDIEPLASQVISWSNAQIVVEIPEDAGTGSFKVTPDGGVATTSLSSLTVSYAQLNSSHAGIEYQTQLIDDDGNGGMTWTYNTDFSTGSGAAPFLRASESWCNATNVHWTISETTSAIDVSADDGINIVSFNNGLPSGTLGRMSSRWSGCSNGGNIEWFVKELDVLFNGTSTWNYSSGAPAPSEYDFESIALHELGHGHQLGHIIEATNTVMHFSLANGNTTRILQATETAGATDVYTRSTTSAVCGQPLMGTGKNCAAIVLPVELGSFSGYAAPSYNVIKWSTFSELNVREHIIERSSNGLDNFQVIARIKGTVHSQQPLFYQIEDKEPLSIGYYRLVTEDLDGTSETFQTIVIERNEPQFDIEHIRPNPFKNYIDIAFIHSEASIVNYQIWNQLGQLVQDGHLKTTKGLNQQRIDTNALSTGLYLFSIMTNEGKKVFKIVKS